MDGVISQSTQELLRPGPCEDVYYADPKTAKKACWRTTINTRFTQTLTNLTQGVSQFTLPPAAGYSDIVVAFQMPNLTGIATGLGLNRGWGYDLISRISYRIGGSSQYFISGAQNKLLALKNSPDAASRDAILALGGSAAYTTGQFQALADNNYAYVVLSIPGTTPSKSNKSVPIPSDLLSQQIVITLELLPLTAIFSVNGGGSVPPSLTSATFQAQQVELTNMADALARRVDMTTHSYSMPVVFTQQETAIALGAGTGVKSVNLTGFRSGEVREIDLWLTKDTDDAITGRNGGFWYAPASVQVSYAGQILARYDANIGALFNLINQKMTSQVAATHLLYSGNNYSIDASDSKWLSVPFAQATDEPSYETTYTSGLEVQNGIIQVSCAATDANGKPVDASGYTLHASYNYNSVIVFSQGTADFAF